VSRVFFCLVSPFCVRLSAGRTDSHLDHVAGVWIAEAIDVTRRVFYRAPYGSYGYGGTRYFPLFFCVHGAAIKLFGAWRATGYALSAVSVVLLLIAVYYLSRRIGAARWLAVAACLAVLAGTSAQEALLTIREDAMAAMLNLWGIAICVGEDLGRRVYYAAALFTLAFAVKETTVFGMAAVFLHLLLNQRRRSALHLLVPPPVDTRWYWREFISESW
jgi:predicted membrane-bound mannosyltransferase